MALKQVIVKVLQLPDKRVLFSHQQVEVGAKAFVTLGIVTSTPIGAGYRFDGDEEQEYITVSKETVVSVNAYGNNAFDLTQKLEGALRSSVAMHDLRKQGMAIARVSPIRNLPAALGGGYEQRAQMDLTVSHIYRLKTAMQRADAVEITASTEQNEVTVTVKVER